MKLATVHVRSITLAVVLLVSLDNRGLAADFTWTGAGGVFRTFGDAANWKPAGGPPNDTNDVAIFDGTQSGSSTFTVNFASNVVNDRLLMTANSGTVTLDLFGRTYTLDNTGVLDPSLVIGDTSNDDARLLLTSSTTLGTVNATGARIADDAGSEGSLTVTTNGRLLLDEPLNVGYGGAGELNILNGGIVIVDSADAVIASGSAATGTVTVSGTGSLWRNDGLLAVGGFGDGVLIVENGGRVEGMLGSVGGFLFPDATGAATVTGNNSLWVNTQNLDVGSSVSGTLTIAAGGRVESNMGTIGNGNTGDGNVTVTGAGSLWDNTTTLAVGVSGTGAMTISQGGAVENTSAQLGSNAGSTGTVTLSGVGSKWTSVDSVYVGGSNVASGGSGTLTVGAGSTVTVGTTTTEILKVWETGRVNLNGGTINTQDFDLLGAFNWTSGTLNVADDLILRSGASGTGLTIGAGKTLSVNGTTSIQPAVVVRLDGGTFSIDRLVNSGSLLLNSGTFNLESGLSLGPASPFGNQLTIGPGLNFNVTNGTATVGAGAILGLRGGSFSSVDTLTNNGEIQLTDEFTTVSGGNLINNGLVLGRGRINKSLVNSATGVVRTSGDQRLVFGGPSNANSGRLELVGGTMEFASALNNAPTGVISGRGALFFNGGLTNQGNAGFSAGFTDVYGDMLNSATGKIIVSGGGVLTFYDDLVNEGELRTPAGGRTVLYGALSGSGPFTGTGTVQIEGDLAPGSSPTEALFGGDLILSSTAHTMLELANTTVGSGYDQLDVAGTLLLGGTLDVTLLDGFAPRFGDTFDLLDFARLSGRFDAIHLPALDGGLTWGTTSLYSTGTITAVPEPAGWLLALVGLAVLIALRPRQKKLRDEV